INGGSISINSYSADLQSGGRIEVSGGVDVSGTGAITYGLAGSISIRAGQDPLIASVLGGQLNLDATLSGFSGKTGGSFSILPPLILVVRTASHAHTPILAPVFFHP